MSTARTIVITMASGVVALTILLNLNPLRRTERGVRHWVEKATPLGSKLTDVEATATRKGWYHPNAQGGDGLSVGTHLRGELGHYQGLPWRTSVTVFWEFDASNCLTNIRIWKTADSL